MIGFFMKLFIYPILMVILHALLPGLRYSFLYQAVAVGILLALLAHGLELILLKDGTFWISNILDFVIALIVVYSSQFFTTGTRITPGDALITAFVLALTEFYQHLFILRTGRAIKSR